MDTHSKERLTGAVILVTVVVLLVPELLSGPSPSAPPAASETVDEAPLRSYTIDLADSRPRPPSPADVSVPAPAAATKSATPAREDPASKVEEAPSAPEQSGTAAREASGSTQDAPAAPPTPVASAPKASEQPQPAAPTAGWVVQIGSFASRENAERLTKELKSKGFAAFVSQSTKGKKLYRVRVGPEVDRAAAEALAGRLRKAGYTGSITQHP